jgi:glycolate oxidase iron-sulfur subunit
MLDLGTYRDMMVKCSHCGLCQATCPVYQEDQLQTHLARARVDLIREALLDKALAPGRRFREVLDRCLLCGNCARTCPAGVRADEIVAAARSRLYGGKKHNAVRRALLKKFMRDRGSKGLLARAGRIAHKAGWLPEELPPPSPEPFEKRFRDRIHASGKMRAKAVYFVGCATNTLYPDTGDAVIKALTANGVKVLIPQGQVCCGLPALAEGDLALAQEVVRRNVSVLSACEADAVVTDCTSCGMMLKTKAALLLPEDDPLKPQALALAAKIWEVTDYLANLGLVSAPSPVAAKWTYHLPCHRGWTPTLDEAPRNLLGEIPEAERIEMEYPESCCGAGGLFFLEFKELASALRARKIADIRATGARTVLTQCPACRSFLRTRLEGIRVAHPISLLAEAFGG